MKVIKHEEEKDWYSVLIQDGDINVWMDVSKDLEKVEWNAYIFNLLNSKDVELRNYQYKIENFENCSSIAVSYLENLKNK